MLIIIGITIVMYTITVIETTQGQWNQTTTMEGEGCEGKKEKQSSCILVCK